MSAPQWRASVFISSPGLSVFWRTAQFHKGRDMTDKKANHADKKANHANEKLAYEIRRHMYDAKNAETRFKKHGLAAGQGLLELRKRIEAYGADWWKWFEEHIGDSREDAERLMLLAEKDAE
jgi:hypothetical protein